MMRRVDTASPRGARSRHRRFRIAVVSASVVAAVVGSALLVMRDSGEKTTTLGVTATLPVPGHPGAVVAGPDAALGRPERRPAETGRRPAARPPRPRHRHDRADRVPGWGGLSPGARRGPAHCLGPPSDSGLGQLAALDWRSGAVLDRHWYDGPVDQIVLRGNELWALEERPGTLLRLDPRTLAPVSAPLRLSPGRTLALASGGGYLWVTAADTGEVLRIDPATRAIRRVHVGGFPIGIVVAGGSVWFADHEGGKVVRLDPRSLRQVGEPIRVGTKPSWLVAAADSLFVTDQDDGTVVRIDVHPGRRSGCRFASPGRPQTPPPPRWRPPDSPSGSAASPRTRSLASTRQPAAATAAAT